MDIETAEFQPTYKIEYADFWLRLAAFFLDGIFIFLIYLGFWLIVGIFGLITGTAGRFFDVMHFNGSTRISPRFATPVYVAAVVFYLTMTVYAISSTIGMKLLKLKVISDSSQNEVGLLKCLIRSIGYFLSFAVACVGFLCVIWDTKKQAWHDKLAGTIVINTRTSTLKA